MAIKKDAPILVLEPFVVPKATRTTQTLAAQAQKLLGYSKLSEHIKVPLGEILEKLEIEVIPTAQVDIYKAALVKKHSYNRSRYNYNSGRSTQTISTAQWQRIGIDRYTHPIPEFVLNKAVQLKKAAPKVSLFVDELIKNRTVNRTSLPAMRPDPFLVATMGREVYYIEVWGEPVFEGRSLATRKPKK